MRRIVLGLGVLMALAPAAPAATPPPGQPVSGHVYVDVYYFGSYRYTRMWSGIAVRSYPRAVSCAGSAISSCPPAGAAASAVTRARGAYRLTRGAYIWARLKNTCSSGFTYWFTAGGWSSPHGKTDLHIRVDLDRAC